MAKDKISDYSSTANSNTDIAGINIDEGCAPSGINDAIRTLMAQLKTWQSGGQDVYIHPAGSASAPSITANGDTNTGIFFPAADTVGISTGGTERARVDSSGNLGLGTTSPTTKVHLNGSGGQYFRSFSTTNSVDLYVGAQTNDAAIYVNSNHPLTFATNATERARIDSSGNFGLGVTPSAWVSGDTVLQVKSGSGSGALWGRSNSLRVVGNAFFDGTNYKYIASDYASFMICNPGSVGGFNWNIASSGTAGANATFTQAMTLDASGNLGIGTTSPSVKLQVAGVISSNDTVRVSDGTTTTIMSVAGSSEGVVGTSSNHSLQFRTNNTERARIDSSGNLLVKKTTYSDSASVGGYIAADGGIASTKSESTNAAITNIVYSTGAGAYRFYVGMGGTVYATSTTISGISDQRLKENIRDLDVGLAEVMALQPRLYDWKEGKGADIKNARGFIAQEFEEVFPDLIDEWRDPAPEGEEPYKSVRQDLIPVLVKAMQEQQAIIQTLTARITALEQ